ncbi:MAG: flavin reductase [Treponema sp.]|nr:flavin reductase [Treponema sp.]
MFVKTDLYDLNFNVFQEINKNWTLVAAKNSQGKSNALTASWGAMGEIWGTEAATVYIRHSRYTKQFIDDSQYFTISLFNGHKDALGVMGSKSGKNCDKVKEAGLTPAEVEGQPTFEEASGVLICKKIFNTDIKMQDMSDELKNQFYKDGDIHTMYIGQIVACYMNK